MAAAAAAALEQEVHSHKHGYSHLHAVANHILHHGHKQHTGEHATITISADSTAASQQQQLSGAGAAADGAGRASPFASADGQSKTAAAVLGDAGLAVAGVAKPQAKAEATRTAIVPAGWPASGWLCSACCQQDSAIAF